VFGEILAGLLLGPSLLNDLGWGVFRAPAGGTLPHAELSAVVQVLARAGRCAQLITVGDKTVLLALHAYGETGEPEVGLPQIYDYLAGVLPFHYLFYAYAGNQLVMINHNDPDRTLALDKLARVIGTYRDGGSPVAADCVPTANKYAKTIAAVIESGIARRLHRSASGHAAAARSAAWASGTGQGRARASTYSVPYTIPNGSASDQGA